MSKICIGVITNVENGDNKYLKGCIAKKLREYNYGYGVFFDTDYYEPFFQQYQKDTFIFSLTDSCIYNNCEILLLPDDAIHNGQKNEIPFRDRINMISDIIFMLQKLHFCVELFIGDSGFEYEDFDEYNISADKLWDTINNVIMINGFLTEMHFYFS